MARRRKKEDFDEFEDKGLSKETKKGILTVFLIVLGLISFLSFFDLTGSFGNFVNDALGIIGGSTKIMFPIIFLIFSYILLKDEKYHLTLNNYLGLTLFILSLTGLFHLFVEFEKMLPMALQGQGGGFLGFLMAYALQMLLGFWGALIVLSALIIISMLLMFNTTLKIIFGQNRVFSILFPFGKNADLNSDGEDSDDEDVAEPEQTEENEPEEKKERFGFWKRKPIAAEEQKVEEAVEEETGIPKVSQKTDLPMFLLDERKGKPKAGDIKQNMSTIEKTLLNFGMPVTMGEVQVGPTITQYTLKPSEGIKLAKITALQNDLALALAAHPIRIEAPIPGKSFVGIEVPNQKCAFVGLRELIDVPEFNKSKIKLNVALGKDVAGKGWIANLAKMPHLLVAGATGSGKSVCLHTIIISLLYQNSPENLRLILVDPKRVELPVYNGIPHLLCKAIVDVPQIVNSLKWTIGEMDRRLNILSAEGKRNIEMYNDTAKEKMPYIVFIIDELADLMITASAEVEAAIIRLTQMARAVGIHIIVATQRPSVDVITGLIKANIPTRIAFSVASLTDSRTILDSAGAEKLLGRGDMLYMSPEISKPKRLQGAFVSDKEVKKVVNYLRSLSEEPPEYLEEITEKQRLNIPLGGKRSSFDDDDDELLDEAQDVVVKAGKASASLLQRRLRVGYARAARLIDLLEDKGVVGPADGARPRDILSGGGEGGGFEKDKDV